MNKILYENRCKCNEEVFIAKKFKSSYQSEGKPLQYPKSIEIKSKTFTIKYNKNLSNTAKLILNNFQNKYLYYAIDDILYLLNFDLVERENLLTLLYLPIISLQNNFSVNFFDIWIHDVYINEISKSNRFLKKKSKILAKFNSITINFFYKTRTPIKKQESLW